MNDPITRESGALLGTWNGGKDELRLHADGFLHVWSIWDGTWERHGVTPTGAGREMLDRELATEAPTGPTQERTK